jgi:hypothetical protein
MAKTAEESLDQIKTWPEAKSYFHTFRACLIDGGVAYGFNNKLAELMAKPDGVSSLWEATTRQASFRTIVASRVQGDAIPLPLTESILKNLRENCPQAGEKFCRDLQVKIEKFCTACHRPK